MIWLGWLGMALVQTCLLPDNVRLWRRARAGARSTEQSVSLPLLLLAGLACYEVYAISIGDLVFIVSNFVGMANAGWRLWLVWPRS